MNRVGINEAAELTGVTRQAIFVAIRAKKLKAVKDKSWSINLVDLMEYKSNRWDRMKSIRNGQPLVSHEKGEYLVRQIAETIGIPKQAVYHAIRTKKLKSKKKGGSYVINIEDALHYKMNYLKAVA